jgi:hypothetical protein
LFFLWWNTLIFCNWQGRFVSGNCHNLCHWTVSSEDSCTRCTNWVVGVQYFPVATHAADTKQFKFNITCSNESQYTCFIVGYGRRWHFGCKLWWFILWL